MGARNLSGQVVAFPFVGAVNVDLWPRTLAGLDPDGRPAMLGCTAPAHATGTVTGNTPAATEAVTIGGKTYTFTATPTVEGDVLVGTATQSHANLAAAINHAGTPGTDYVAALAHPAVLATASSATTVSLRARNAGTPGNVGLSATGGISVSAVTLTGGAYATLLTA